MDNDISNNMPRRYYLVDQVTDLLRDIIAAGDWGEFVPSERALSHRFQVGRNTLRQALRRLEKEGLIEPGHVGRRRRILAKHKEAPSKKPKRVVMLTPDDPYRLSTPLLREANILRKFFNEAGIRLDLLKSKAFNIENCDRVLDRLTHIERADIWILQMAPHQVQKWFCKQDIPAMVIGYTFKDVDLPYVTENRAAAARHAIGILSSKGHKRIALLQQKSVLAGHEVVLNTINEISERGGMETLLVNYDLAPEGLCRELDRVLESDKRPTALLTTKAPDVWSSITHLAQRKIAIPRDMSLISLIDDNSFDGIVPELTRYSINVERLMRQVFTMAQNIMAGHNPYYDPVHLIPDLIQGGTVAKPASD